jgi:hypothetical protein
MGEAPKIHIEKLIQPTAALNVTLGRLAAEYFGIAEDCGIAPGGQPSQLFWESVGRLVKLCAKDMTETGSPIGEIDLIREYLKHIVDGATGIADSVLVTQLN